MFINKLGGNGKHFDSMLRIEVSIENHRELCKIPKSPFPKNFYQIRGGNFCQKNQSTFYNES